MRGISQGRDRLSAGHRKRRIFFLQLSNSCREHALTVPASNQGCGALVIEGPSAPLPVGNVQHCVGRLPPLATSDKLDQNGHGRLWLNALHLSLRASPVTVLEGLPVNLRPFSRHSI